VIAGNPQRDFGWLRIAGRAARRTVPADPIATPAKEPDGEFVTKPGLATWTS